MSIATSAFRIVLEAAGGTVADGECGVGAIVWVELGLNLQECRLGIRVTRRDWTRRASAPRCQTTPGCPLRHRDFPQQLYLRLFTLHLHSKRLDEIWP